ncbi:FAD:protein FMN transferase [Thermocrinis sp.]|uniref:FAD:protein FMN transferase n=1 Tax=Thermocrinis sp. TaxID=2024383 RepID=UPI002616CA57|nr:FAD:protein FMN transferase [Thermocrinis sp.]
MGLMLFLFLFLFAFSQEKVFHLMGTYAIIDLPSKKAYQAYKFMKGLEEKLSDYIEGSEVSKINQKAGVEPVEVSADTLEVIKKSLWLSELTEGAFDITVGAITIRARRLREFSEDQARNLVNYKKVRVEGSSVFLEEKGMAIDLGGIGKGFAIQKAYEFIKTDEGFIAIAGDLRVWGHKRLLAVYNPINGKILTQGYNKKDLCLSTSGNYRREHIVGKGSKLLQVTVAYEDCTLADGLSTALFAMDDKKRWDFIEKHPQFGYLLLFSDGSVYVNKTFLEFFESLEFFGSGIK